jgi:hypothetical protein
MHPYFPEIAKSEIQKERNATAAFCDKDFPQIQGAYHFEGRSGFPSEATCQPPPIAL